MMIITQPLITISAARGKMTQKAICGKDADIGGLLLAPRRTRGGVCAQVGKFQPGIVKMLGTCRSGRIPVLVHGRSIEKD
jgi:hypothetical protein